MTAEQLIQTWRIEGSVAIHLRKALQDTCSEERIFERLIFGDTWTRNEICGSLYEALYEHADMVCKNLNADTAAYEAEQARREAELAEISEAAEDLDIPL